MSNSTFMFLCGALLENIIYAIGDVHGRSDLLEKLLDYIRADAASYREMPVVYFLGDVVDRGWHSREVLNLVVRTLDQWQGSKLHLGNHDFWFRECLTTLFLREKFLNEWLACGGEETLFSYFPDFKPRKALSQIAKDHPRHVDVLKNASMITVRGNLVFAHAGIDRQVALSDQSDHTLMFARYPFLNIVNSRSPVVIHGHTIFQKGPVVTENRISIDTGACKYGRLSACRIRSSARDISFFAATGAGSSVDVDEVDPVLEDRGQGTVFDRLDDVFGSSQANGLR